MAVQLLYNKLMAIVFLIQYFRDYSLIVAMCLRMFILNDVITVNKLRLHHCVTTFFI